MITSKSPNRFPSLTLLLALAAVAVHLFPDLASSLQYERGVSGPHCLLACHFIHWSSEHLLWDAMTFLVLGALCEARSRARLLWSVLTAAVLIPVTVMVLQPDMPTYRGLSGLDSTLFVLLAVGLLEEKTREHDWAWAAGAALALLGFAAKVGFELATGRTVFLANPHEAMVPVPLAHLVGGLVGCAAALAPAPRTLLQSITGPSAGTCPP